MADSPFKWEVLHKNRYSLRISLFQQDVFAGHLDNPTHHLVQRGVFNIDGQSIVLPLHKESFIGKFRRFGSKLGRLLHADDSTIKHILVAIALQQDAKSFLKRLVGEIDRNRALDFGSQEQVQAVLYRKPLEQVANFRILDIQGLYDKRICNRKRRERPSAYK